MILRHFLSECGIFSLLVVCSIVVSRYIVVPCAPNGDVKARRRHHNTAQQRTL